MHDSFFVLVGSGVQQPDPEVRGGRHRPVSQHEVLVGVFGQRDLGARLRGAEPGHRPRLSQAPPSQRHDHLPGPAVGFGQDRDLPGAAALPFIADCPRGMAVRHPIVKGQFSLSSLFSLAKIFCGI